MHVRITLDAHELVGVHAARTADTSQIIALQVDQHDVFRALLRMHNQRRDLALIFSPAAWPRSGNRSRLDAPTADPYQSLGRGAQQAPVPKLRQCRKRRRVYRAQTLVQRRSGRAQWHVPIELATPRARQIRLIDVAGPDVVESDFDASMEMLRGFPLAPHRHTDCPPRAR